MPILLSEVQSVKRRISEKVKEEFHNFKGVPATVDKRLQVIPDLEMYREKEDVFFWNQGKGNTPRSFSIVWDGQHICIFDTSMYIEQIMALFLKSFLELYKERKVYFFESDHDLDRILEKEEAEIEKKKIDSLPEFTPEQKITKKILKNIKNAKPSRDVQMGRNAQSK